MELTPRFIGIGLLTGLLFACSSGQIIVQPGYTLPRGDQQDFVGSSMQQNSATDQQSLQELGVQLQRYRTLRRLVDDQIRRLNAASQGAQVPSMSTVTYGNPQDYQLSYYQNGGYYYSPYYFPGIPATVPNYSPDGLTYSAGSSYPQTNIPAEPESHAVRSHWTRSISGKSGLDRGNGSGGSTSATLALSNSPVKDHVGDSIDNLATEHSTDEADDNSETDEKIDSIVGSSRDSDNHQEQHPTDFKKSILKSKKKFDSIDRIIDTAVSKLRNHRPDSDDKDPMSLKKISRKLVGTYRKFSPYHQSSSQQDKRNESTSYWNAPKTVSDDDTIFGRPQNTQKLENSPIQGPQNPIADASPPNYHYFQQAQPSNPTGGNPTNSPWNGWMTTPQQTFGNNQPSYPIYQQPSYQQNQNIPQTRGYPASPPYNWESQSYGYPPFYQNEQSAPVPYNHNDPNRRSSYGLPGTIKKIGRTVINQLPRVINSFVKNPEKTAYINKMFRH